MAAIPFQDGFSQFFDNSGNPLASGLVYTYIAGTTTPQAAYTTAAGTTAHTNPIVLDSGGRASIFLGQGRAYRIDVKTSAGVLLKSVDNIAAGGIAGVEFQEELQTAADGQTVFTLTSVSYRPGTKSLRVYEDGVLLERATDYTETDASTVTLTAGAADGAKFTFSAGADATDALSSLIAGERLMPEWNGLVIPSVQFRGTADTSASLGTLGYVFDADNDAAAAALFVSGAVDESSTINGSSDVGTFMLVPTPAGCSTVHVAQLGMSAPLSLATSGTVDAASAEFMRFDFTEPVQYVYILEGPPTNYAGASGTGSARMVSVYGVIEA